jgi:hypothetical protein
MCEAFATGAAVANCGVTDQLYRIDDHRTVLGETRQTLDGSLLRRCSHSERVAVLVPLCRTRGRFRTVRAVGRTRRKDWSGEALTASQHIRVIAISCEYGDSFLDVPTRGVVERRSLLGVGRATEGECTERGAA